MRIARYAPMMAVIALLAAGCASQESARTDSTDRDATDSRDAARVNTGVMHQYNINGPIF